MSGFRTRSTVFMVILALTLLGAVYGAYADTRDLAPAENTVINYPAYPTSFGTSLLPPQETPVSGAPYLVATTFNPTGPRVVLVFNEAIDPAMIGEDTGTPDDDFVSETMDLTEMGYGSNDGDNVLYLTFPNGLVDAQFEDGAIEEIALKAGEVRDLTGYDSIDVSTLIVGDGPVITRVEITGIANDLSVDDGPNDNHVLVTFDADVVWATGVNWNGAFGGTIEFNEATLTGAGINTNVLDLSRSSGNDFLYMQPGVMNLHLDDGYLVWEDDPRSPKLQNVETYVETTNDGGGPLFHAMYYHANLDVLVGVFDQMVTTKNAGGPFDNWFTSNPAGAILGGVTENWYSTFWSNIVRVRNFSINDVNIDDVGVTIPGSAQFFEDYQGQLAVPDDTISIHVGGGIVRSSYDENKDPSDPDNDDLSNDALYIYLSLPILPAQAAQIDDGTLDITQNFDLQGFAFGGNEVVDYQPPDGDNFPVIIIRDFSESADPYEQGCRIRFAEPVEGGTDLQDVDGNSYYDANLFWTPVMEESRPRLVTLTNDWVSGEDGWTFDEPNQTYTAYLRFYESGIDDGDQYFLYPVLRGNEGSWDKTKMATYLDRAIALGNMRPRQIDGVNSPHRIGLSIYVGDGLPPYGNVPPPPNGTIWQTVEGDEITSPSELAFLLAAADWQGNVGRIETINPEETAWEWLYPGQDFFPCRVYIEPVYCSSPPALEGQLKLYGLHYIHGCNGLDPDRVRFERLKEIVVNGNDLDAGEVWETIGTVGGSDPDAIGERGDQLIYRFNSDNGCRDDLAFLEAAYGGASRFFSYGPDDRWYSYYNADNDYIVGFPVYSSRDAVIEDVNENDVYDEGIDIVVIGSDTYSENIPDGVPLTRFTTYDDDSNANPAYYWAEQADDCDGTPNDWENLDPSDYIFRENRENYTDYGDDLDPALIGLNLWKIDWDPCGDETQSDGDYIVRTIAITRSGEEDQIQEHQYDPDNWNPLELQIVTVNCSEVDVDLTVVEAFVPLYDDQGDGDPSNDTWSYDIVTLDLDTTPPDIDEMPKNARFFRVRAVPAGEEIENIVFTATFTGEPNEVIGPNPDGDSYADLNGLPGFQYRDDPVRDTRSEFLNQRSYAPYLDDERIRDVNENWLYDPGIDEVLDAGRNAPFVDTPEGQLLVPLVREDVYWDGIDWVVGDWDNDGQTVDDQDSVNQADSVEPYFAYYDLAGYAVAGSQLCDLTATVESSRECPESDLTGTDFESILFRDWTPPIMTGPVRVETEDDEVVDVFHPVSDGDPYQVLGPDENPATSRTFLVHVTAEDSDEIEWVRLWYRPNPACTTDRPGWKLLSAAQMDTFPDDTPWDSYPDRDYPYNFRWTVHEQGLDLTDGNYQFFAEAIDGIGNYSWIPVYPYGFGFNQWAGEDLAYVIDPVKPDDLCLPSETVLNIGDGRTIVGEVDPDFDNVAQVRFYFAPRIQNTSYAGSDVDANLMLALEKPILDQRGAGVVVCIGGVELVSGVDYTASAGDTFITFAVAPDADAEITVSYNFMGTGVPPDAIQYPGAYSDGWLLIAAGDDVEPFTVEWAEGPEGGVPDPENPDGDMGTLDWSGANAYDLVAVGLMDLDGSGWYEDTSVCDLVEPIISEGNHVILREVARPIVHLYGLDYEQGDEWGYPQQEPPAAPELGWPGNPFGLAPAGTPEHKGSGVENDVFVTASTTDATAEITEVKLDFYQAFESDPFSTVLLDVVNDFYSGDKALSMALTMYVADYYEVRSDEIENVALWIREEGAVDYTSLPMSNVGHPDYYQVIYDGFMPGTVYEYRFFIDKIGDDDGNYADRRNSSGGQGTTSLIALPDEFYYYMFDTSVLESDAYRVLVTVTDNKGMVGTNLSDGSDAPQGPIMFMYDKDAPIVSNFWADNGGVMPGAESEITVHLESTDGPDINVITTRTVVFQYSPNKNDDGTPDEWLTFAIDRDPADGWSGVLHFGGAGFDPPESDGYDNDGDGEVDLPADPDEIVSVLPVRAVVFDDAGYGGDPTDDLFPGSGNPVYAMLEPALIYDGYAPTTMINNPHDGDTFLFGDVIQVTGTADDHATPESPASAIDYVVFEYRFEDADWIEIDPTPNDNTDLNRIEPTEEGQVTFNVDFDTNWLGTREDTYLRFRMLATDVAGNTTIEDDLHADEVVVIVDDQTAPGAFLMWMNTELCGCDRLTDETGYANRVVTLYGMVTAGSALELEDLVGVDIMLQPDGGEAVILGRADDIAFGDIPLDCRGDYTPGANTAFFVLEWDTDNGPDGRYQDGLYQLWAEALDADGNRTTSVHSNIQVDREAPAVVYGPEGGRPFVNLAMYFNDGVVDHESPVIAPDPYTGDVEFYVYTPADDMIDVLTLQWRLPGTLDWNDVAIEFHYAPGPPEVAGHKQWIAHIEDFADNAAGLGIPEGVLEWRVLATDAACNTNANQADPAYVTAAVDFSDPTLWDFSDNQPYGEIAPGENVDFHVVLQDAITDVRHVQLYFKLAGDETKYVIASTPEGGLGPDDTVEGTLDTPNCQWLFDASWVWPTEVFHDTPIEVWVMAIDPAGNALDWKAADYVVRDENPPVATKIIDVEAKVFAFDTEDASEDANTYVWVDRDGSDPSDTEDDYDYYSDFVLSTAGGANIPDETESDEVIGMWKNTWPRDVNEGFLGNNDLMNKMKVARLVTIVARTRFGDDFNGGDQEIPGPPLPDGDDGIEFVEFFATPVDEQGQAIGDPVTIGKDEYPNGGNYYYLWHLYWDLTETNLDGSLKWSGWYKLSAKATDEAGNVEEVGQTTTAIIKVDMDAPTATLTADPDADRIQRNEVVTFLASTDPANEDDTVEFFFKRTRDVNFPGSYHSFDEDWSATDGDINPDHTRPYSFNLDLGSVGLENPDDVDWPLPLQVGEQYDFSTLVEDEVGNATDQVTNLTEGRGLTFEIIDTIPPHMTITEVQRTFGDTEQIMNPTALHASSIEHINAKLLTGHLDLSYVNFVYRKLGTADTPTLIDAVTEQVDRFTWRLTGPWDLTTLDDQTWYEVAALGADDAGNTEPFDAAAKILVFVDWTAPPFALLHPTEATSKWCDAEIDERNGHRIFDLIAQITDRGQTYENGDVQHDDVFDAVFEWKWSYEDSTLWRPCGVSEDYLYDDALNTLSKTMDFDAMEFDEDGCKPNPDFDALGELIDLRVRVMDVAGNANVIYSWKNTLDTTAPDPVNITNIKLAVDDPTQDPIDFGQVTEVTRGLEVEIWATASDDEANIPNAPLGHETFVTQMQFQVAEDLNKDDEPDGDIWRDLGTIVFDPADLDDPSAVTGSVLWNTTGLVVDGEYLLRVTAIDECGNAATSGNVNVIIRDNIPPTARVVAFDPDQDPHGENPLTYLYIYALAESDPSIEDVLFQYDTIEGENDLDHEWVNIGFGEQVTGQHDYTTEVLWRTRIETTAFNFQEGALFWLRALAKDSDGNRYGDDPADVVPMMRAELIRLDDVNDPTEWPYDGAWTFRALRTAPPIVEDVSVQIESADENSEPQAILTVDMPNSTDRPRVVVLGESDNVVAPNDYWWIYSAGVPSDPENGQFGLVRSLDDPTVWRGRISLTETYDDEYPIDECLHFKVFVTGMQNPEWFIDEVTTAIHEFPVTTELGTNGTVVTQGYGDLYSQVTVVSGAWMEDDACLLVSETIAPQLSPEERVYLTPLKDTAWHIEVTKSQSEYYDDFREGYLPTIVIKYSDEALNAALAENEGVTEEMLTVRRWDYDYSDAEGIMNIRVNTEANEISFNVDNLSSINSDGTVFEVFAPKSGAPVFLANVTPHSAYLSNWVTDADPIFSFYLHDIGGQGIEASTVKVKVDDRDVATFYDVSDFAEDVIATWVWGAGGAHLMSANDDGNDGHSTIYELDYFHSPIQRDWLAEGDHTITVEYRTHGTDDLTSVTMPFTVDLTAPIVEFHGGWVSNPLLRNVHGYIAGDDAMLTVRMYDPLSGIFVRPERQEFIQDPDCDEIIDDVELFLEPFTDPVGGFECFNPIDWGIHYDLWRVDGEDEQLDIDEFEERELLHEGTADELLPYLEPPLYGAENIYDPSEELLVKLPIVGGGRIQDGDILEVTLYSQKTRTLLGEGPALQCDVVDTLVVGGETLYVLDGCWFDFLSQQRIIYQQGVLDQVRNSGSKYVEQRFIVDALAPECAIILPASVHDPNTPMVIEVTAADTGVGVGSSAEDLVVIIRGPDGEEIVPENEEWNNGHYTATIPAPLAVGDYTITVTARDRLGHTCSSTKTVRVEATMLTLTDVYTYPNPFDPADGDALIHFALSKTSDVTIKVYDFAGNYVTTLASHEQMTPSKLGGIYWGGTASDGTKLANGAYIVRVTASDGARTEEANLKVVLWRE